MKANLTGLVRKVSFPNSLGFHRIWLPALLICVLGVAQVAVATTLPGTDAPAQRSGSGALAGVKWVQYRFPGGLFSFQRASWMVVDSHGTTRKDSEDAPSVELQGLYSSSSLIRLTYYPHSGIYRGHHLFESDYASAGDYYHKQLEFIGLSGGLLSSGLVAGNWKNQLAYEYALRFQVTPLQPDVIYPGQIYSEHTSHKPVTVIDDVVLIPLRHGLMVVKLEINLDDFQEERPLFQEVLATLMIHDQGFAAPNKKLQLPSFPATKDFHDQGSDYP